MKLIAITGNVGSGKTTLAKSLSEFEFVSIDECQKRTKRVKPEVDWFKDDKFLINTNKLFRSQIVKALKKNNVVIDGSGANLEFNKLCKELNAIVFDIKLPINECWNRIKNRRFKEKRNTRKKDLLFISKKRNKVKLRPDYVLDGKKTVEELVKEIKKVIS